MRLIAAALFILVSASTPAHLGAQLVPGRLVVAVTAPAAGATVGGTVPFQASVSIVGSLTVRNVEFKVDGVVIAEDTAAPYSIAWNTTTVANGSRRLTACARDLLGIPYESEAVTVTVFNDVMPPSVSIAAPAGGSTVSGAIAVTATASDNVGVAGVRFFVDGAPLGAEDTTAPYSIAWNTATAAEGMHTLAAIARDAAGNTTTSASVSVRVDNVAPAVAITAPAAGATVSGSVTITASASDSSGIAGVQFLLDGAPLGAEDTTAPYAIAWNTAAGTEGMHSLAAIARDAAGKTTTSASVSVSVDNVAPAVAITAPAPGAMVSGSVTITANASDSSGIAGVQFLLDGAPLGAEDTTAPYSAVWNTAAAADGSHTLAAIARDAAGKTMTSASVSVSVDNVAPAVAITAPAAGATVSGSVTITASASDSSGIAGVQFLLDGAPLGAEDTTAPYSIAWDTTTASSGPHAVSAVARDGAGRSATASPHTVSVSNVSESTVRIEDTSSSIAYAGSWSLGNTVRPWSGGTAALATGGPTATGQQTRATLTFTGIAVRWIGYQSPQTGIARVYLDGTLVATIDTYSSVEVVGAVLYEVSGLANMQHTLAIEATGTKNAAASDIFVVVDAFDVTTTSEPPAEPPPGPPATRVEDTDPTIVYTPGSVASAPPNWWHGSRSRGWSGETSSFNRSEGARATFAFTGTSVTWIGFRAPWAGIGRVYVDGALVQEVDLYSPTEQPQAAVFTAAGLAPGSHTIVVESTAGRNPSATDNAVVVDAFDVGPAAPPRVAGERIEHGAAAVAYTGTWTSASGGSWSGGGAVESFAPGAQARVAFAGTTVSLVGLRGPRNGIARIYLDGAFHATVDTYAATEIQSVIFTDTNLAPGWHELVVEVSGLKHAAATDYRIVVDAFDVAVRFEEVDPAVVYTGSWSAQNFDEAWSGTSPNYGSGSATRSATAGARAEFTFVGTAVRWIGYRGPVAGIARVFVDGALAGEVDAYASIKQVRAELFSAAGLSPGSHTIAIEVTGSRNPSASNAVIVVDAFDVTLPAGLPVVTRFQQTAAAYPVGPWEQSSPNPLYTGATVAFTTTAGARADFSFTGSGVRWIGHRAFANRFARVYLDGVHVADVNTIAPVQEEFQAVLFGVTGLTDGPHTLSIVMLDPQEPAAATNRIIVDAFDVIR